MNVETFNDIFDEQIKICKDTLIVKAKEYATEDRLHNFKVVAVLEDCTHRKAVSNLMGKHTVSIYDMCNSLNVFPMEMWNEKIKDHINYLILLKAVVTEEALEESLKEMDTEHFVPLDDLESR